MLFRSVSQSRYDGAGFWDGDYENGEKLTELCEQFQKLGLEDELQGSLKG